MNRKNILIFIIFLILFTFFVRINDGWDFNYSYYHSKSIVNRSSLNVDPYGNRTASYWHKDNHTFPYSRSTFSIFSSSIYWFSQISFEFLPNLSYVLPEEITLNYQKNGLNFIYKNSNFLGYSRFFLTLFIIPLFGSLTILIFYKLLNFFIENETIQLLFTIGLSLGTSVFAYSTSFNTHIVALFFFTLSLYLLIKYSSGEVNTKNNMKYFLLAGLLSSFAASFFELMWILVPFLFVYVFLKEKIRSLYFISGSFLGTLPYLVYKHLIGSWTILKSMSYHMTTSKINNFVSETLLVWSGYNNPYHIPQIILRMFIYPYRGIFIYSPFIILSIPGIVFLLKSKKWKKEGMLILGMSLTLIFFVSLLPAWWGHFTFGPRRLILLLPLLVLSSAFYVERSKINWKIVTLLVLFSISLNILSLQQWEGGLSHGEIDKKMNSWEPLGNPILNRYIPLMLRNGPRSILFENLILEGKIDIWNAPQICKPFELMERTEIPIGIFNDSILTLRIPFLGFFILLIILFLIWRKRLCNYFGISSRGQVLIILLIIFLFFGLFLRTRYFVVGKGWNPIYNQRDLREERTMKQNGTIYIYSSRKKTKNIDFEVVPMIENNTLEVYLNGDKIKRYDISKDQPTEIKTDIKLKNGINILKFHSDKDCIFPKPEKCNLKCANFKFSEIHID